MKKLDNFSNSLTELKNADFQLAYDNAIYRMGVIGQFNLTFELAWKALQAVLHLHGSVEALAGSPKEILQLGYRMGFINDEAAWLMMLRKRNVSVHIYSEQAADELLLLIRDSFTSAFEALEKTLREKINTDSDEPIEALQTPQ
ncbi:MAG: HI0074 family nucleotidyltransferase substrate-binding subunit [Clostridiales bacterium]|nr:HI0074 family nucleotidyltransferase substrate-binding subunit [Clostridiales bacterium]